MIAFENLLVSNIWLSLVIWWIVYASDYSLTIYSARLYGTTVRSAAWSAASSRSSPALAATLCCFAPSEPGG